MKQLKLYVQALEVGTFANVSTFGYFCWQSPCFNAFLTNKDMFQPKQLFYSSTKWAFPISCCALYLRRA